MRKDWQIDYSLPSELSEAELSENHSLTKMLDLVGYGKHVVDVGCATGYFARLLKQRGCDVTGIEVNPRAAEIAEAHCKQVVVADLDYVSLIDVLPNQTFDVVVFGDVLEHLRDPWTVLEEARQLLEPDGYVVASIPNIAHGAVRLSLLQGQFKYEKLGLLDNTHLRFFTRETVEEMFEQTGYLVDVINRTVVPIFSEDNQSVPQVSRSDFSSEIIQQVEQAEDSDTLQFVLRAMPLSLEGKLLVLSEKYARLLSRHEQSQAELQNTQTGLQLTQDHVLNLEMALQYKQGELEQAQNQLLQQQAAAEQFQTQFLQQQDSAKQLQIQLVKTQNQLSQMQIQSAQAQGKVKQLESELQISGQRSQTERTRIKNLRTRLQTNQLELEQSQEKIVAMQSSKFWKLRTIWFKFRNIFGLATAQELADIAPSSFSNPDSKEPSPASTPVQPLPIVQPLPVKVDDSFDRWLKHNQLKEADLKRLAETLKIFHYRPLISVIMPVYNPPERFLREAIESVIAQVYPYWELCIADDASTAFYVQQVLKEYAAKEPRIKVVARRENGHISRCSNSALEVATGEFVALLDHDDLLTPDALYEVALMLNQQPELDMIYSDEDKVDEHNRLQQPFFKPDWCPDSFLSRMYICHLGVYRRSIVNKIGGFRIGFEGSQDYDLVLRFTEETDKIAHIPKILYHWRIHSESAANNPDAKPYAFLAGEKALSEALERRNEKGKVTTLPQYPGIYSVRYQIQSYRLVSIIIPTKNLGEILDRCLESIFTKSTYPNYEVLIIDNGSTEPDTAQVISKWLGKEPDRLSCHVLDIPFNYSKLNNYGVSKARGEFLLFLNNDTEVITSDWIDALVEQAQRPSIGAVGALLLYPDNTIQHAGVVLGIGGVACHSHRDFPSNAAGYHGQVVSINNYSAVTAACLMCKREAFDLIEGFNESLAVAYNDVDFCLKLRQRGMRNVYLPHVVLYHYESKSRGQDDTPQKQARAIRESEYMYEHWQSLIECDPCYSPHLTLHANNYDLRLLAEPEQAQHIAQLQQAQAKTEQLQSKLEAAREELEQAQNRVAAMETSKFWKLRKRWFRVKQLLGSSEQA